MFVYFDLFKYVLHLRGIRQDFDDLLLNRTSSEGSWDFSLYRTELFVSLFSRCIAYFIQLIARTKITIRVHHHKRWSRWQNFTKFCSLSESTEWLQSPYPVILAEDFSRSVEESQHISRSCPQLIGTLNESMNTTESIEIECPLVHDHCTTSPSLITWITSNVCTFAQQKLIILLSK